MAESVVMPRAEARAAGLKRYFTGAPCKHGHVSDRFVSDSSCAECRKPLAVLWQKRNPDRHRQNARDWREANKERHNQAKLAWNERNKERIKEASRAWYERNKEAANQARRAWAQRNQERQKQTNIAWRELNKDRKLQTTLAWKLNNRERVLLHYRNKGYRRRSRKRGGMSSPAVAAWLARQPKVCHWCGKKCAKGFQIDHYVPLARGGEHVESNLVVSCPPCNMRKSARDPYEFAAQVGRLF